MLINWFLRLYNHLESVYCTFFLMLLFFSCSLEKTDLVSESTLELSKVGNIRIPLNKDIPAATTCSKVFMVNGEEFLFLVNKPSNCLVQISLKNPENVIYHFFDVDGPEGIGAIRGAAQVDGANFIIVSQRPIHYFYNLSTKALSRSDLLEMDSGKNLSQADLASTHYTNFDKIGSDHYFLQTSLTSSLHLGADNPDYKLLTYYSPSSSSYHYAPFVFPKAYNAEKSYPVEPSMACDGKKCVISFMSDHNVHLYDGKKQWSLMVKSQYAPNEMPQLSYDDPVLYTEYMAIEPIYKSMIYDPYRDVFYRILQCNPTPDDRQAAKESSETYLFYSRQFSVMTLSSELKILGEYLLPPNRYLMDNIVVTQQGLAISAMHPKNEDMEEDFLVFDVFLPITK